MASSTSHRESLTVKLGAEPAEANAAAVASTMQAVVAIVEEAQQQIQSNEQLLLKARPFAKGSFEIPFDLIVLGAATLFDVHPLIGQVLDMLKDYLDIKKMLKGEPVPEPAENGTIVIQGNTVQVSKSVINILCSGQVNSTVDRAFSDIEADDTIKDVKVYRGSDTTPIATIPNTEFAYFKHEPSTPPSDRPDRDRNVKATLTIRRPVLEGRAKWDVNYEGNSISADLRDEDFKQRVDAGIEEFARGDRLEVELTIVERYNPTIDDYERKGAYVITKVLNHIKQPHDPASKPSGDSQTSFLDKNDANMDSAGD